MAPPRRRRRGPLKGGGTKGGRGGFLSRTAGGTKRKTSGSKVATGGTSTDREKGIAAYQSAQSNKIKGLEQSIGSLDRRINKALKDGNTDLAKDLRSRLNKFTTKLGNEKALRTDGGVVRTSSGAVVTTSDGSPVLTSRGLAAFNQTKDRDFLDPTRNLINKYPDQYAKMYPITNQVRQGLPGSRLLKGIAGVEDKAQALTEKKLPGERYALDKTFGAFERDIQTIDDFDKATDVAPPGVPSVDITGRELDVAPAGVPFQTMVDSDQPSFPTIVNPTEFDASSAGLDKNVALGDDGYKTVKADTFVPKVVDFADAQRVNPKLIDLVQPSFAELDQQFKDESLEQKSPPEMTTMSGADFASQVADNNLRLKESVINDPSLNNNQKQAIVNQIDNLTQFQPTIDQTSILDADPGQSMFPTASINALNAANPASEAAALEILNSLDNQNQGFNLLNFLGNTFDANPDQQGFQLFNLNPKR